MRNVAFTFRSVVSSRNCRGIEYAYVNKENLNVWGKIGRKIVKEKYTWEKVAEDLEDYLLSVCD